MLTSTTKAGTRVSFNGTDNYVWVSLSKQVTSSEDAYGIVEKIVHGNNNLVPVIVRSSKSNRPLRLTGNQSTFFTRDMLELE